MLGFASSLENFYLRMNNYIISHLEESSIQRLQTNRIEQIKAI